MLRIILTSLFVLLAATSPFDIINGTTNCTTNGTDVTNSTNTPLWTGDVPDHGYVELYGDAHDVLKQIFDLNPALRENELYQANYNPYMDAQPRPFNESLYTVVGGGYFYKHKNVSYTVAGLASRGSVVQHEMSADDGYDEAHYYCGTFATGNYQDSFEAIAALQTGQNGYWTINAAVSQDPPKPTCMRLSCSIEDGSSTNTAVYWCNDNPFAVTAPAPVLAAVAGMVASGYSGFEWAGCCLKSRFQGKNKQYSGQIFIGNGTNINVGWGDCSVPNYFANPTQYAYPGKYGECS